ncbi:aldo/keto reductase [Clostridium sp. Mt-5]|uniref:Aldo/keto reductase n=1 Tax=Clostridium moutaii TaxID=3240932 RepID=A0ABV4BY38_9CLOT
MFKSQYNYIDFGPFNPLGNGFLTGTINKDTKFGKGDIRSMLTRFLGENMYTNQILLNLTRKLVEDKNVTLVQIALAWIFAQKPWMVPI